MQYSEGRLKSRPFTLRSTVLREYPKKSMMSSAPPALVVCAAGVGSGMPDPYAFGGGLRCKSGGRSGADMHGIRCDYMVTVCIHIYPPAVVKIRRGLSQES